MPSWAFELTPGYLSRLKALVVRDRVKLIVDLNLVTDTPLIAAAWARAAETSLPQQHHRLRDRQRARPVLAALLGGHRRAIAVRCPSVSARVDARRATSRTFASYARVLGESAPDIPLLGPAVAHPRVSLPFISALIADQRPGARDGDRAPVSLFRLRQAARRSPGYPTVPRLLSRHATSDFRHRHRRRGGDRPRRRAGVPADRVQLGHLRRQAGREQHVRHRAVGARRAVHRDAQPAWTAPTCTFGPTRSTGRSRSTGAGWCPGRSSTG